MRPDNDDEPVAKPDTSHLENTAAYCGRNAAVGTAKGAFKIY